MIIGIFNKAVERHRVVRSSPRNK